MLSKIRRRVKIVCTLGPSSQTEAQISSLIKEGLDVARLNFSHGTHEFHRGLITAVRESSKKLKRPVAIMQDLQGPKIRVGSLTKAGHPQGLELKAGDSLLLYPEGSTPKISKHGKILVPISAEIAKTVTSDADVGALVLFDDGKIAARATQVESPEMVVEVEVGGRLTDHKGMNLPGTPLSIPCLTDKDYEDLKFGLSQGVDAVALSFVRSGEDIDNLREKMRKITNDPPWIVAKVEREEAIDAYESIIELSDGLLVARGDMAVEIGAQHVPTVQKKLIHACNELGVPIITATQMLESMIGSPTPTRAEASDVANAVYDGTDAVMLSAETASGQYPAEAVRTMSRIILEAERSSSLYSRHRIPDPVPGSTVDAIEAGAATISEQVGAVCVACFTHSGMAARTLARFRPSVPIVALMEREENLRKLSFVWGVRGVTVPKIGATDDLFETVESVLQAQGWAEHEDTVVVTAGIPSMGRGTTNMIKVHRIGARERREI